MLPKYICAASSGHAHACRYTRIALDDAQSEWGISKSSAAKSVYAFMTSADRLLYYHVVISEDRNY